MLKKYKNGVFANGKKYNFQEWAEILKEVIECDGTSIINPLTGSQTEVIKIRLLMSPICFMNKKRPIGKILGSYVSGFVIHTSDGFEFTESPLYMSSLK